jgi:hypothetical protein
VQISCRKAIPPHHQPLRCSFSAGLPYRVLHDQFQSRKTDFHAAKHIKFRKTIEKTSKLEYNLLYNYIFGGLIKDSRKEG